MAGSSSNSHSAPFVLDSNLRRRRLFLRQRQLPPDDDDDNNSSAHFGLGSVRKAIEALSINWTTILCNLRTANRELDRVALIAYINDSNNSSQVRKEKKIQNSFGGRFLFERTGEL